MSLKNLTKILSGINTLDIKGSLTKNITGIQYDSRNVKEGDLFVCIQGFKTDGHTYADDAIKRGAQALIVEKNVEIPQGITVVKVKDSRSVLGKIASNFYNDPSSQMYLAGVTGTNGKTTTTFLIRSILSKAYPRVGLMGTIYNMIDNNICQTERTTQEAVDTIEFLNEMVNEGVKAACMEVSSHAVSLKRIEGLSFNCGVFTNLTRDHLDFHGTMDEYLKAKGGFFASLGKSKKDNPMAVINIDDEYSDKLMRYVNTNHISYSILKDAHVRGVNINVGLNGSSYEILYKGQRFPVNLSIHGYFNIYNSLAAFCTGIACGLKPPLIIKGLEEVSAIPGRFESVDCGQDFVVIVDYAHTPDGLENVLKAATSFADKKVYVVFGCGGDRDRTKRPLMGKIAVNNSTFAIVTSDNPRTEDPLVIIEDIKEGLNEVGAKETKDYEVIPNRRKAIERALDMAGAGDIVMVCGKGHETYQIIGETVIEFDDRKVVRELLKEKELC